MISLKCLSLFLHLLCGAPGFAKDPSPPYPKRQAILVGADEVRAGEEWGTYTYGIAYDLGYRRSVSEYTNLEIHGGMGTVSKSRTNESFYREEKTFPSAPLAYCSAMWNVGNYGLIPRLGLPVTLAYLGANLGLGGILTYHPYGNFQTRHPTSQDGTSIDFTRELPPDRTYETRWTPDLFAAASVVIPFPPVELGVSYRLRDKTASLSLHFGIWFL